MNEAEKILETEYYERFDTLRKNRMVTSYFKYGAVADNYCTGLVNAIENLEDRLQKYKETGNTEFLVDVANMAMIEFMFPQHKCPVFETEHGTRLKGVTITDLKNFWR